MKMILKWTAIAICGLIAYAFLESLSEAKTNLLYTLAAVGCGVYCVMDFVAVKHREIEHRLSNLYAKLDDLERSIPASWEIAEVVRKELDQR